MKRTSIFIAAMAAAIYHVGNATAGDLHNYSALVGDYVASNPGLETAIPVNNKLDTNKDGILETETLQFDVYKTGTQTKLFSTKQQTFTRCPSGAYNNDHDTVPKRIGNMLTVFYGYSSSYCIKSSENPASGVLWGFDLSGQGKPVWVKPVKNVVADGHGLVADMNGNGLGEWLLTGSPRPSGLFGERAVSFFDGKTGTEQTNTYPSSDVSFDGQSLFYVVGLANAGAMVGDFVASNPGLETVIVNGHKDSSSGTCLSYFDVYKAGTNTKLFSSPESGPSVCDASLVRRLGNTLILSNLDTSDAALPRADFHALNLSREGNKLWTKAIKQGIEGMGILPDMNKNGTGELLLTTVIPSKNSRNVAIYDGETGAALSNTTYPNRFSGGWEVLSGHWSDGSNDALRNISPLVGDYVASNPGLETVVPDLQKVDKNGDGLSDAYELELPIYKTGTLTKLFTGPNRAFTVCSRSAKEPDLSHSVKRIGNTFVVVTTVASGSCTAGSPPSSGFIYAVNLSVPGTEPWTKSINGNFKGTGILPDMNGNGTGELLIVIQKDNSSTGKVDWTTQIFDGGTGATLASQTYVGGIAIRYKLMMPKSW